MMTFRIFASKPETIPSTTSWYLADLGEARGKQDLFAKQSPQKLKALRETAMIESAVSSNRIEGVTVDQARIKTIIFGKSLLRDRDEEEVRGYRDALELIHEQGGQLPVSEETIRNLHRLCRGGIRDAGQYKEQDGDIIERYPDGRQRVRFKTVVAARTPASMAKLIEMWGYCQPSPTLRDRSRHHRLAPSGNRQSLDTRLRSPGSLGPPERIAWAGNDS